MKVTNLKFNFQCGALLMADMAHISGLVAAGIVPTPFECVNSFTVEKNDFFYGTRTHTNIKRIVEKDFVFLARTNRKLVP